MGQIQVSDDPVLDITGELTLSCWALSQTDVNRGPLVWKPGAYGMAIINPANTGGFSGGVTPLADSDLQQDLEEWRDLQWHFFSMTYSDANDRLKLYVDTILKKDVKDYTQSLGTTDNDLFFANDNNGNALSGELDEIQIWSEVRTQAELREDLRGELTGNESNLEGLWRIDEGTGTTVADATGNGNDGTVTSGTWVERTSSLGGVLENPHSPFVGLTDAPSLNETQVYEDAVGALRAYVILNVPPPNEDADYHQLRYRRSGDDQWATHEIMDNNTFTTVTISGLSPGVEYEFGLVPYSRTDNLSGGGVQAINTTTITTAAAFILDDFEDGDISEYSGDTGSFSVVSANTIDDFEDDDLSEYGGDTGEYRTQSSVRKSGVFALEAASPGGINNFVISSTTGLNNYPSQGDTFRFWVQAGSVEESQNADAQLRYATQDQTSTPEGYGVGLDFANDLLSITGFGNASTFRSSTNVSVNAGTWYQIKLDWANDGTMTATLLDADNNELATTSGQDTTYTSGGIGFLVKSENERDFWFDGVQNLDGPIFEGDHSLKDTGTGTRSILLSRDDKLLETSNTFEVWLRSSDVGNNGTSPQFHFGVQDVTKSITGVSSFAVRLEHANQALDLIRYDSGTPASLDSSSFQFNANVWYRITVDWKFDGTLTVRVYNDSSTELTSVSPTDDTYAQGGFGFGVVSDGNGEAFFDFARQGITP